MNVPFTFCNKQPKHHRRQAQPQAQHRPRLPVSSSRNVNLLTMPVSNSWNGSVPVSNCWNGSVLKLPVSKRSERGEKNIECSIMGRLWRQQ